MTIIKKPFRFIKIVLNVNQEGAVVYMTLQEHDVVEFTRSDKTMD